MDIKTRIKTIHLMDMLQKNPVYAEHLKLEVALTKVRAQKEERVGHPAGGHRAGKTLSETVVF